MRSLSMQRRTVRRIAIGTVTLTLVGIGSVLALGASWAPNRAVANSSAINQPAAESLGNDWVRFDGDALTGNEAEQTAAARSQGSLGGDLAPAPEPGALCCVTSTGSCMLQYGSACPSGSTPKSCPCWEPV